MTADQKLQAFFQSETAPARDYVFNARLREEMARHRFRARLKVLAIAALVFGCVLYGFIQASGLYFMTAAAGFFVEFTSTPGLALGTITVAAALVLPRFLPGRFSR